MIQEMADKRKFNRNDKSIGTKTMKNDSVLALDSANNLLPHPIQMALFRNKCFRFCSPVFFLLFHSLATATVNCIRTGHLPDDTEGSAAWLKTTSKVYYICKHYVLHV